MAEPAATHPPSAHAVTRSDGYERRRPEETVLYQTIAAHWPVFRERMEESGGLPQFVVSEFEEYLDCGRLEAGCLLLECRSCGYSQLVAFSCKRRGFCPGCVARRMADTGVHLEQRVLPEAPVRHWICSLPWGLRALLGYDKRLCADILAAVIAELGRSLKWRAKKLMGLPSVSDALTGAVGAVQRVDSALRLNVHFHILYLDGVYVLGDGRRYDSPLTFHDLPTPTRAETTEIASRIADRVEVILKKHGRSLHVDEADSEPTEVQLEHPALAACYDAAALGVEVGGDRAGQATLRLMSGERTESAKDTALPELPVAEVRGINLYGRQWVHGGTSLGLLSHRSDSPSVLTVRCCWSSRKLGRMGVEVWSSRPRTCWCASALQCRRRAFTWCAIYECVNSVVDAPEISATSRRLLGEFSSSG